MSWVPRYKVIVTDETGEHTYKFSEWLPAHDFRIVMCDLLHIGYDQPSNVSKVIGIY